MQSIITTVVAFLILIPFMACAGTGYEQCIKHEKSLREKEAGNCSGLSLLFNPSGCYSVQKELKEYDNGKCNKTSDREGVRSVTPEQTVKSEAAIKADTQITADAVINSDIDTLTAENRQLKSEIIRLKKEIEALTNK